MKRVLIVVAAVAVLAGCGTSGHTSPHLSAPPTPPPTAPPDALSLAKLIPNVTPTTGTSGDVPPVVPAPTTVARYDGPDGLDIIATFSTNAARTTWVRAVVAQYGSDYVEQRVDGGLVDGECWTVITTAWHTYRRGDPPVQNLTDARDALHGTIKSIDAQE